jgi:hypothetical protein
MKGTLMSEDEKPYGDTYMTEFLRLHEAQKEAATDFAAQTLYLREEQAGRRYSSTPPEVRQRIADEAAETWLRIASEIEALNRAEYRKKQAAG